jgi:hypothetical protein
MKIKIGKNRPGEMSFDFFHAPSFVPHKYHSNIMHKKTLLKNACLYLENLDILKSNFLELFLFLICGEEIQ